MNWRALPLRLAATLAAGLPQDSRCGALRSGTARPVEQLLLAVIADRIGLLTWRLLGAAGQPPPSLFAALHGDAEDTDSAVQSFDTPEEFMAALRAAEGGE